MLLNIVSLVGRGTGRAGVNHFLIKILEGLPEEDQDLEQPGGKKLDWQGYRGHYSVTR